MFFIDLVARCATESCQKSIRLSMYEDLHFDNTRFSQKLRTKVCGA